MPSQWSRPSSSFDNGAGTNNNDISISEHGAEEKKKEKEQEIVCSPYLYIYNN